MHPLNGTRVKLPKRLVCAHVETEHTGCLHICANQLFRQLRKHTNFNLSIWPVNIIANGRCTHFCIPGHQATSGSHHMG